MNAFDDSFLLSAFAISRETIARLRNFQQLVITWNSKFNLISQKSVENFWVRHIIDSLQLLKFISNKNITLVDIGSGAGFPGIVLSIAGVAKVILIEADSKKSAFLLQAAMLSDHDVEIRNKRIEEEKLSCEILTARAFSDLNTIFRYTKNANIKDKYLLLKSKNYQAEIDAARKNWCFDCKVHNSETMVESKIVEISNLR